MSFPVTFDVEHPPVFQRAHLFLCVGLLVVIGWIGHPFGLLWLGVPVVAAIVVSQSGGQRYLDESGPTVTRVLGWVVAVLAYLALLTDRLPGPGEHPVRLRIERSGSPTVGSALLRILYAIPSLIVLAILAFVGAIVWVVAVVLVLVDERYPDSLWRFLLGLVRWEAYALAYLLARRPLSPVRPRDRLPVSCRTLKLAMFSTTASEIGESRNRRGSVGSDGCDLYYEEVGEGVPILLVHPAGSTASTWGAAVEELARIGRVIAYDRRGYARSGGEPVRSMSMHTVDAAALLEYLRTPPAVVVGTSAGAAIAVDLAVRRPELVRAVIAHEFPWRYARHLPTVSQVAALAKIGSLALRGRHRDAAETLLRSAYTYRDGGSAWDTFPEEWRRAGRENARAALADFRNSIGVYPSRTDLATIEVPVVCSYGARSPNGMARLVRSLAAAIPTASTHQIEGAGHAAPFDATTNFVQLIADTITA